MFNVLRKVLRLTGVVSLAVSVSVGTNAFGSLIWAMYSGFCKFIGLSTYEVDFYNLFLPDGRRPIYLASIATEAVGSFGVASSRTVPQLLGWRVVQAFGASSGLSVGVGVIGDIYKLEERGTASGIFFAAVLLGAAVAPCIGGVMSHYYSWRGVQYALCGLAIVCWVLTFFFQPETSQPGARGIDKARAKGEKVGWVWLNPLKSVALLRSPNVLFLVSVMHFRHFSCRPLRRISVTGDRSKFRAADRLWCVDSCDWLCESIRLMGR